MAGLRFLLERFKPRTLLPLGDLLLVNLAILLVSWRRAVTGGQDAVGWDLIVSQAHWFLGLSALWLSTAVILGLYTERTRSKMADSLVALLAITALFLLAYVVVFFFAPVGLLPRRFVLYTGVLSLVLVGLWRAAYITISAGLTLARSASVRQRGGVIEFVRQVIREISASDGQRVRETTSVPLEGQGVGEQVYTVEEVAKLLKVHKATIWRWCQMGELPAFRVGQQWRIRANDLQRAMATKANMRPGRKS